MYTAAINAGPGGNQISGNVIGEPSPNKLPKEDEMCMQVFKELVNNYPPQSISDFCEQLRILVVNHFDNLIEERTNQTERLKLEISGIIELQKTHKHKA